MAKKHLKKCLTFLVIMKMQIKTTLGFYFTTIRMAKQQQMLARMWRNRNTSLLLVNPLWKTIWWFLRKLEIVLPEDPAIPLLGIYPKDVASYHKDTCSIMFIAALFIIARSWKQPTCPSTEEWIQKMWFIYTMEYYSVFKNNDFMKF